MTATAATTQSIPFSAWSPTRLPCATARVEEPGGDRDGCRVEVGVGDRPVVGDHRLPIAVRGRVAGHQRGHGQDLGDVGGHGADHQTIPSARSVAMRAASRPTSASTSSVCSPRVGARWRIEPGVADRRKGVSVIGTSAAPG